MSTNRLLKTALAVVMSASAVTSAFAATSWDMPTPYGDRTFHTVNIRAFADDVAERTGGDLTINVHSNGSLIGHAEIKNAVRRGIVPSGELIMSRLANENAIFDVDSVPFLASNYDEAWALWQASKEIISEELAKQRIRLLFAVPWPPQGLYSQKELNDVSDLRNLKIRAYNLSSERLSQLVHAVPTQIEVPDIPTAFSTGRVDAMMTSPATGADTKAWDYLSHFNHTQLWIPKNMVIVNEQAFSRLSPEVQQAVLDAAEAAEKRGWEMSQAETQSAIQVLKDNGIQVSEPSEALSAALKEIGDIMTHEWLERAGAQGQAILQRYAAQ
ncbi:MULTISPECIES: TRAP transporter substrate-binding protein [Nitrincola]|uniref:Extracytoplasmic solute receptor protein yiaO n=1 Tax=Nitrincola nitratireducens TaxID=1229521 RepID=W9V8F0_9GAMM|nr:MULTISPECIES: TRAP transporter substrate-binding protein [Nitrincola]EXJ12322.1 Extracytoplasmic solute receptor protein yiaO [Nitrincola nitratireducens]